VDEHRQIYAELFDKTRPSMDLLVNFGLEIPYEVRVAAEVTLSDRLFREVERLPEDFRMILERGRLDQIVEEAKRYGYCLRREEPSLILNQMLNQRLVTLQEGMVKDPPDAMELQEQRVEELVTLIDRAEQWGFELRKGEAQNIMNEMLDRYFGELEMSWWGWGPKIEKPFPSNLILLAERLDFNADRFSKIKRND